jgi:hypothetical protein
MRRLTTIALLAALLGAGACAGRAGPAAGPQPSRHASPRVTPDPAHVEGRSSPLPDGRYRFWPASEPAEPGAAYAFELYTHCGLDHLVDFDASLWAVIGTADDGNGNPPEGFNNPFDEGTMTLVEGDVAEFRGQLGGVARFSRLPGSKDIPLCE